MGLRHYSVGQQMQIADERNALPEGDILREVLQDWEGMRRQLR